MTRTLAAAIFALLTTITAPAHAVTLTWDVEASGFAPPPGGGTVTGSFNYDSTLQQITNFNLNVAGPSFTPYSLNQTNAQVTIGNNLTFETTNITFADSGNLDERVFFQTFLTNFGDPIQGIVCFQSGFQPCPTGVSLDQFSNATGPSFLQGALVVATPLPAALTLFGSGLAGLAGAGWMKRRRAIGIIGLAGFAAMRKGSRDTRYKIRDQPMSRIFALVVFVLLAAPLAARAEPDKVQYELQEQCRKAAQDQFGKDEHRKSGQGSGTYENHYNKTLNKCFAVDIEQNFNTEKKEMWLSQDLLDVNDHKTLGTFYGKQGIENGKMSAPFLCEIKDTFCHSLDEWTEMLKPYMED